MKFIHFVSVSVCDPGIFMLMIFLFEGLFGLLAIGNFFFCRSQLFLRNTTWAGVIIVKFFF